MVRFGNSPGEFMGRTNSQSCLGMGSRTCIPNGSFVFVGYVNRTTRTIPKENLKVWNKILAGALIAFFPLYGLGNMLPAFIVNKSILTPLSLIITSLSNFSFMLVLVSGVIFAFYNTNMHYLLMKITPYGKMSLTNYITQSIVGSMLYYNWGFALHNQCGITVSCLAGIAFFILQFTFCRWWMSHHSHGPMEYIWKRATWLK